VGKAACHAVVVPRLELASDTAARPTMAMVLDLEVVFGSLEGKDKDETEQSAPD
jgi:hypothetical protein